MMGIAGDFQAEFFESFSRRATFTSRRLLQADADDFHHLDFSWLVGKHFGMPALQSAHQLMFEELFYFYGIISVKLKDAFTSTVAHRIEHV